MKLPHLKYFRYPAQHPIHEFEGLDPDEAVTRSLRYSDLYLDYLLAGLITRAMKEFANELFVEWARWVAWALRPRFDREPFFEPGFVPPPDLERIYVTDLKVMSWECAQEWAKVVHLKVYAHGVFDIFHYGQASNLVDASDPAWYGVLVDIVGPFWRCAFREEEFLPIVGVDRDKNVRDRKGPGRPYFDLLTRISILARSPFTRVVHPLPLCPETRKERRAFFLALYKGLGVDILLVEEGDELEDLKAQQALRAGVRVIRTRERPPGLSTTLLGTGLRWAAYEEGRGR